MKKVMVAMSGGVDSSVAAALLKEQGYDVYGVTMRLANWQETEGRKFGGCCGSKDFYDARSVAQTLGIPHYQFDYVDHFRVSVIDYFKKTYLDAETPNPCIACNQHVKFDKLLAQALAMGADYLATGHYARILPEAAGGQVLRYRLAKAVDSAKDQSYVLYHLGQQELAHLLFPLGERSKTEVRRIAHKYGLKTADKPDSYEICFVPNEDYKQFIDEQVSPAERPGGPIRHVNGNILGRHRGLPYYTVGQREGLGLAVGRPLYVVALEKSTNTLVVGERDDVVTPRFDVRDVHWVSGEAPPMPLSVTAKIRSKSLESPATLSGEGARLSVHWKDPQSAVTPGQSAVFYDEDVVLGGGIIARPTEPEGAQGT